MARKKPKRINVNLPGYTPDWKTLIETDPTFSGYKGKLGGQSITDKAYRNAEMFKALLGFGAVPELSGVNLGDFGLTQEQINQIRANTAPSTSTSARLAAEHARDVQNLQDMLAARGMLRSGSLGTGLRLEQEEYAGAQANALSNPQGTGLLDILAKLQGAFAGAEQEREEALYGPGGAAESTQERLSQSGLFKPRSARTVKAVRDPATGLYRDADGNYYDRSGSPVSPEGRRLRRGAKARYGAPYTPRYGPGGPV